MADIKYSNQEINRFWLNIFAENSQIILNALSPDEEEDARRARALVVRFDNLTFTANQNLSKSQLDQLNKDANQAIQDFREFVLHILKLITSTDFHIDLKPLILNHMVTMAEYYIYLLATYMRGQEPTFDPILEDVLWLPFFVAHCSYISDNIGYYRLSERQKAQNYQLLLNQYWSFSFELQGISRIGTETFPMAVDHRATIAETLKEFYEFLTSLGNLLKLRMLPGSLSVLMMNHMQRMLCFYLRQLSVSLDFQVPDCDPYAKRISSY